MTFSEFANLLAPSLRSATAEGMFTFSLFEAIVEEDEGLKILQDYEESTYRAYFRGDTGISRLARRIVRYIDPVKFENFLRVYPDPAIQGLCEAFQAQIPDITPHNAFEKLAQLFERILREAAAAKRKSAGKGAFEKSECKGPDGKDREFVQAEVVEDKSGTSGTAEPQVVNVIQNQVNVIQNGPNNQNITNTGTLILNF